MQKQRHCDNCAGDLPPSEQFAQWMMIHKTGAFTCSHFCRAELAKKWKPAPLAVRVWKYLHFHYAGWRNFQKRLYS